MKNSLKRWKRKNKTGCGNILLVFNWRLRTRCQWVRRHQIRGHHIRWQHIRRHQICVQFHQQFTGSFLPISFHTEKLWTLKNTKIASPKNVGKLTPGSISSSFYKTAIAPTFFFQIITNSNVVQKNSAKQNKRVCKILMKLTPEVNFINMLMRRFYLQKCSALNFYFTNNTLPVQLALVICGPFICDFAYMRLRIGHFSGINLCSTLQSVFL